MQIERVLEKLGLPSTEARVYLALLELGAVNASAIVRKTNIHRANVYGALERLTERGLIASCVKEKVNHFTAAEPARLLSMLEEQKTEIAETEQELKDIIPRLVELGKVSQEEAQQVTMFRGVEAFKLALEDVLSDARTDDYYVLGYTGIGRRSLGLYHKHWDERRVEKGIVRRTLASEENRELLGKSPLTKARYLPGESASPASTTIYNDKIVFHVMEHKKPLAVMIRSQGLADSYRRYFQMLWSIAKR